MTRSLAYLVDAIVDDLGDVAEAFPQGFFERAINEGQARFEPELLLISAAPSTTIDSGATTFTLPDDCYDVTEWLQDENGSVTIPHYRQAGQTLYFNCALRGDWNGTLFYRAHYPLVTDVADCQLPLPAADGLISFALYRSFRRLAAGRSEYRKYATIIGNAVAMADLEQAASIHLQDFEDARTSAMVLLDPTNIFGD